MGDALRTTEVDVHGVALALYELARRHHRGRVVAGEVGHEGAVGGSSVPNGLAVGGVLDKLMAVHHWGVAQVGSVATAKRPESELGAADHGRENVLVGWHAA